MAMKVYVLLVCVIVCGEMCNLHISTPVPHLNGCQKLSKLCSVHKPLRLVCLTDHPFENIILQCKSFFFQQTLLQPSVSHDAQKHISLEKSYAD